MLNRVIRTVLAVVGGIAGISIAHLFLKGNEDNIITLGGIYAVAFLLGGCVFYLWCKNVLTLLHEALAYFEGLLQKRSSNEIIVGSFGLIIGLLIANLISIPVTHIPVLGVILAIAANALLGYLGISISVKKKDDWSESLFFLKKGNQKRTNGFNQPKILDTSVIIDGRISDLCRTGFIEGTLIIPSFILRELQHIADSSDPLKRNRGRRGLDILNIIQKELDIPVEIVDKDFEQSMEVDSKLLKLAQFLNGKIITNDYNLNKVAEVQGVPVLNINELANAVKPIVLPGEDMMVQVVKDGKENGQGIAYLDDGTMIVVDGGKKFIGESIGVMVTSVLQTPAGRMIFAKPKMEVEKAG